MFHFLQGYSKPIKRVKVISNNSFLMKISRIHLLCQELRPAKTKSGTADRLLPKEYSTPHETPPVDCRISDGPALVNMLSPESNCKYSHSMQRSLCPLSKILHQISATSRFGV